MNEPLIEPDLLRRLEQLTMVSRRISMSRLKGERRSRRRGASNDFADYRNYVPGDDLRFLDWKIYARLERLFLKLFLEEQNLHVFLLLDTSRSMATGDPDKLLYAKRIAAALGYITLCKMDTLTIHTFGDSLHGTFGPKRGKTNARACFSFLDQVRVAPATSLATSCRSFAFGTRGKGLVIIVSDFLDPEGYEPALRYLFGRSFEVFAIHVLSPQELKPEIQGDLQLVDCESGATTDVSLNRSTLELYQRSLEAFRSGLRSFVLARGGTYLATATDLPFERLVLDLLVHRGVVQ